MKLQSLRVRLILAYAGLIVLGFGGLAFIAGRQLSEAARNDYELQLANEVILVARGVARSAREYQGGIITEDDLNAILADYEAQTNSTLTLYLIGDNFDKDWTSSERDRQLPPDGQGISLPPELQGYPEVVAATQNAISIVQRENEHGDMAFFTAALVSDGPHQVGYVQLSEPASHLQQELYKRWGALGFGVLVITVIALLASIWLSTSFIRPLGRLRDSTLRLSQGDLSHRIADPGTDEIGEVAQAFNQMADQVSAMIEEQRAFASNTSHELRTPLTTMRLRTEALRHDMSLSDTDRQQYIIELDEELIRLSGLVEDLILLSRFDAGRAALGKECIDLDRFSHSLHRSLARQASEKGITLQLDSQLDRPVQVEASLNHLAILFRNLLDNAIKYTQPGGTVIWRITATDEQAICTIQEPVLVLRRSIYRTCLNVSTALIRPGRGVCKALGWGWPWSKPLSNPMPDGSRLPARVRGMVQLSPRIGR